MGLIQQQEQRPWNGASVKPPFLSEKDFAFQIVCHRGSGKDEYTLKVETKPNTIQATYDFKNMYNA